jgi:hypothetical protein
VYSKGRKGILSRSVQGWERDSHYKCKARVGEGSLCKCTARVGKGFSLEVYNKGGRGILSVSVYQGWERDFLGEGFSGRGILFINVQQGWETDSR